MGTRTKKRAPVSDTSESDEEVQSGSVVDSLGSGSENETEEEESDKSEDEDQGYSEDNIGPESEDTDTSDDDEPQPKRRPSNSKKRKPYGAGKLLKQQALGNTDRSSKHHDAAIADAIARATRHLERKLEKVCAQIIKVT